MSESKEKISMSARLALPALLAALALSALAAAPAGAAESAWWQLLTGSRPSNLTAPASERQALQAATEPGKITAVKIEGEYVACIAEPIQLGDCLSSTEGKLPIQTAAELQEALEAPAAYGPGGVAVSEEPAGERRFLIDSVGSMADRWVPPLETELGGSAEVLQEGGSGQLVIIATNLGDAPLEATSAPLQITDELPAGVSAYGVEAFAGAQDSAGPVQCELPSTELLSCGYEGTLPSYEAIEVELRVSVDPEAIGATGKVSLSGGGAAAQSLEQTVNVSEAPVPFGIESFSAQAEEEGGALTAGAATNPFQVTNTIQFNSAEVTGTPRREAVVTQPAIPRNTGVTLPAGVVGSATAVKPCPLADFVAGIVTNECPDSSAVGVASVTIVERALFGFVREAVPIFALPPQHGEPARFGFKATGVPVLIDTSVDPDEGYRITGEVRNAPQTAQVLSATLTLWGVPGDRRHDSSRGWDCAYFLPEGPCPEDLPNRAETPLLRVPGSCAAPLTYRGEAEPWGTPLGSFVARRLFTTPALFACNQVPFDPEISNALTSKLAANPSGLDFELTLPHQWPVKAQQGAKSEAQPKKVEVTLPRGVTINPSQAEGLAACSEAAYGAERYDSAPGEGCPEASKIGSVRVSTPLLDEEATGALYVATPYENPTGAMIALYLVARIPERGILVKQAGKVEPDPDTGQLVSTFDEIPQVPFDSFKLHFREGGRSPLITPPGCGTFTTTARFTPWSASDPDNPAPGEIVERSATMTIDHGVDGGACPTGPAPFDPGFEAGTLNNQAGSYSPFLMRLTRQDGEQDMGKLSFVLPPGVVPKLAGIPYCPEAGIAQAMARQGPHGGEEEKNDPSCPAASEIGRTVGGAGVGNQLTYVPGKLYLAGPYNGDPISAVAITPAVAGPFDAGTVVVREALRLNPVTHVGEVDGEASDPIPHILKGIPLNLRELQVYADRPEFTLNATSCDPLQAAARIWGEGTALEPQSPSPVDLSSRYQAAGCRALGFKPKLSLRLKGGTKRGKFPALRATYVPKKKNQANLRRMALLFPSSEFIEQGHFRTICTRVQFKAGNGFGEKCPKRSIYGHVKAWSPLLDEPLQGPVYLRSSNHNLPDAVFALHGLIDIEVSVRIDSVRGRLRATVQGVPDAPVSRAVVRMQGGQKGLFVNSRNLCHRQKRNHARANLSAQSNRRRLLKPLVRALGCGKKARRGRAGHRRARANPAR